MTRYLTLLLLLLAGYASFGQKAKVTGKLLDSTTGKGLEYAYVIYNTSNLYSTTNLYGEFNLEVPADTPFFLTFQYQGLTHKVNVKALKPGENKVLEVRMRGTLEGQEIGIQSQRDRAKISVITLKPGEFKRFSNPSGNFENILKTLGVASGNNELSSGFNVRGGNYDENLIYVNDIEIYRPQLIRSGQQEGLSFINSDLVNNIEFSAGGFSARYGDKLSSVLDITYRKPDSFSAGGNINFLGASLYMEGRKGPRFRYLVGARYRSNAYLFGSLDVQGNYQPRFMDIQSLMQYDINSRLNLSWLGALASNRYLFVPESQRTSFGTVSQALQLTIFFNGAELMRYLTTTNALTLKYTPNVYSQYKLIASAITSNEREYYTVEGAYRLDELDKDLGSSTFGQAKFNRGAGYFINHARNELQVQAYTAAFRGLYTKNAWNLRYGADYRKEIINDVLNEWVYNDSADYSIPNNSGDSIFLYSTIRGKNQLNSNRITAFVEQTWDLNKESNMILNAGLRYNYWDLNGQSLVSPRMQFAVEPNRKHNLNVASDSLKKRDYVLKAAWGVYYQPPFYRELRTLEGRVRTDVKAQRSIHYVLGADTYFKMWGRTFKFFSEVYYKDLDNLIPYYYENVRIRYYANNNARGYATGIDTRVNGEFIEGLESWFSLSFLQTRERIKYTDESGAEQLSDWLRRPTDQRINMGIFFQDELPRREEYKVHVNLVFGSGLPYFLGGAYRYTDEFSIPAYRRVDMGFSREFISPNRPAKGKFWSNFHTAWVSLDVFNILGVANTASYIWVRDVSGQTYAVPNYLTSRRVNLNFIFKL